MPVVQNTVTDPTGTPLVGVQVVVICIGNPSQPVYDGTTVLEGPHTTVTDNTGSWSLTLPGNAGLSPAGTYYQVIETVPVTRQAYISTITVPTTGGPYALSSILSVPPASLGPQGITGVQVGLAGTVVGSRPEINLIQGSGATLTVADNPAASRVDVTVGATGGVPTTRAVNTTTPLTGGGTLAADLTLAVSAATTGSTGVMQLAGDLAGTATNPTVPTRMKYRGAWTATTAYAVNDLLTYLGDSFLVTTAFTSGTTFGLANLAILTGKPYIFDVTWYGAKGDGKVVTDGAMTATGATLTSATAAFSAADVGKAIMVKGAAVSGVTTLVTTIASVTNATTAVLAAAASTTVTGAYVLWGSDDTAAIQAAINAATSYAQTSGGYGQVRVPTPPTGQFYALASALVKGGTTKGNAHLTLAPIAATVDKVTIEITGVGDATALFHWQQTTPQFSGSTLVSFGVYSSLTAQTTDINTNGNPALIGGPNQAYGYGINTLLFSNMLVVLRNLAMVTTFSTSGIGYGAFDFSGLAEADLFDCSYGVATTFADLQSPTPLSAGLCIGGQMPAAGNNDNNVIRNLSILGGYTYALFATEHTIIQGLRITYCWAALVVVGAYDGSVGASHAVYVDQFSCEGCTRHVYLYGSGQSGIGPTVYIAQLDTEGFPIIYDGSNTGQTGGFGLGDISVTGFNPPQVPNPTGVRVRNLLQQPGYVATPSYTLGTPFINPFWRDASVTVSGGTVTGISIGKPTAGVACLGGSAAPAMQSLGITSGTVRVPAGGWLTIAGSVAPTCVWQLD